MKDEASSEFPRRPVPVVGESLYGFERRFACCTRYATLSTFRHALGLTAFGPRSVTAKWQKLRIQEARRAWTAGEFPRVPGDEKEWIPIPGEPKTVSYP